MPLFGAHMSIAGGFHKAPMAAAALDMESVQLFTHSPSQWAVKPVSPPESAAPDAMKWSAPSIPADAATLFQSALKDAKLKLPLAHDSYLINLASPDVTLYRKSIDAFTEELRRAETLGLSYLVMHPGAPTDQDEAAGLERVAAAFDAVHARCPKLQTMVLLETTAGQGCTLGHRFEHLAWILDHVKDPDRLGVCLDTCHVFAAGYPLFPIADYRKTFREFDKVVGVAQLKAFHVNDSLKPQGSRVDRHAHIGKGHIGLEAFHFLVNDRRFRKHPMILETPKEKVDGEEMDAVNLRTLREMVE